jgi:hypothetical protein
MRSPLLAVADVMSELHMTQTVQSTTTQDPENPSRWLITFESAPASLAHARIEIEVLEGDPHPFACVLDRTNVGRLAMNRIMNKLMNRLEAPRVYRLSAQSPPGGEPAPS